MKFAIVCDSAADLTPAEIKESGIKVVPFYISFDGEHYVKDGVDIGALEFHQKLAENPNLYPKTSMPTIPDYGEAFYPFVKEGIPVLCICLTSKFSGSYQTAVNTKLLLESNVESAKIHVMDSQLATGLEGVLVKEAIRLRNLDLPLEEAVPLLEEIRRSGHIFFTTKDLKYLRHGGRLGTAAFAVGSVLNIKPILRMSNGELESREICRGQRRSIYRIVDMLLATVKEKKLDLRGYFIGTGIGLPFPEYEEFLKAFHRKVEENDLHPDGWVKMQIGATIGVHTGPFPVGVGFIKRCVTPK